MYWGEGWIGKWKDITQFLWAGDGWKDLRISLGLYRQEEVISPQVILYEAKKCVKEAMCRLDREAWARYGIMVQGQDSPSNKMFLLEKNQNSKWRIGHWEEKKKSITLEITSKRATSKTSRKVDFCCHVLRITKKKKKERFLKYPQTKDRSSSSEYWIKMWKQDQVAPMKDEECGDKEPGKHRKGITGEKHD